MFVIRGFHKKGYRYYHIFWEFHKKSELVDSLLLFRTKNTLNHSASWINTKLFLSISLAKQNFILPEKFRPE